MQSLEGIFERPVKAFLPVVAVCTLSLAAPAYAYIDPGTAGIILQAIIGGSVAALALFANFWCNIKAFFAKLFGRKPNSNPEDAEDKE